jgi:chromosome segregation ATPase
LSADYQNDHTNNAHLSDMRSLDSALRDVLTSASEDSLPKPEDFVSQDDRQVAVQDEPQVAVRTSQKAKEKVATGTADHALPLIATMDVVTRAANAIDELVLRNHSVTDAAVRSVEFFRKKAVESAADVEMLREELRIVRAQADAQRVAAETQLVAAEAHIRELETEIATQSAELAAREAELASAQDWIDDIRAQVASLLGDAQTRLDSTSNGDVFGR